jgi:DNA repair protein SbcD/Mre11
MASLRIAHLADTHIGMENYGRINSETGLNQRLHDFLDALDQAIDGALAENVDVVVFAGDIYKTRDPTPTHQREFAKRIHRLSAAGVHTVLVAGNHDVPLSAGRASSVDIFRALEIEHVTVARTLSSHRLETRSGALQVIAFPWAVRSNVLAQPEYKNATIAELNQALIDLTRDKLRWEAEALDPQVPAMVVGHAHLFGARIGAERLLTMGSDPMYEPGSFDLPHVDYVALGHIHKHQALHYASPPMVYAGSVERVDFGEEHEDKGWVLVQIPAKGQAEWEFRKLSARPFLTIDARVESDNATQDVVRAIARQSDRLRAAVVKLRIDVAPERAAELRNDEIMAQLKGAYFVTPFERVSEQRPRSRWGAAAVSIQRAAPLDALSMYLEYQKVDVARRELLVRYARELAAGSWSDAAVGGAQSDPRPLATDPPGAASP